MKLTKYWVIEMADAKDLSISVASMCVVLICNVMLVTTNFGATFAVVEQERYAFFHDAMKSIEDDKRVSAIGIGSSMIFNAFDGKCMEEKSNSEIGFYNLGIHNSTPYTNLLDIDEILNSNVEIVLIELAPRGLGLVSKHAKNGDYLPLRFETSTMFGNSQNEPEWAEIILPEHRKWLNTNDFERTTELQKYTMNGIEYKLQQILVDEEYRDFDTKIPRMNSHDYVDYLKLPDSSLRKHSKIESMNEEELSNFNDSIIGKEVPTYYPRASGTRNHMALEYMVDSLLVRGKEVVIVTMPHYEAIYDALDDGQWDGFNETTSWLSSKEVHMINLTFDRTWKEKHFADQIHLDWDGREYFCERVAPEIDKILGE